jgi:hypothetical protein
MVRFWRRDSDGAIPAGRFHRIVRGVAEREEGMAILIGMGQSEDLRETASETIAGPPHGASAGVRLAKSLNENITLIMQCLHGTAESRT